MSGRTFLLWFPVVLYMAAIAVVSHQPNLQPPMGTSDWLWHMGEYAVLSVLLLRALTGRTGKMGPGAAMAAMVISIAFGVSDEIHQSFVPGRTASFNDVMADAAGAGVAVALALGFGYRQGSPPRQIEITVFGRADCHLCDEAEAVISSVTSGYPVRLEKIDVDTDPELRRMYGESIPVVAINGRTWGKHRIDPGKLRRKLDSMIREKEHD